MHMTQTPAGTAEIRQTPADGPARFRVFLNGAELTAPVTFAAARTVVARLERTGRARPCSPFNPEPQAGARGFFRAVVRILAGGR